MSTDADLKRAFVEARELDGSMRERLDAFADAMRRLAPDSVATIERFVDRLSRYKAGENAPNVGDPMPPFVLPNETGRMIALTDLLARGPAIVTFHRGHWCPWCRISINTLARAHARVRALGAKIVVIVPDREQFTSEMKSDSGAPFPILTDMDNGYAMSLNLAIWVGDEMREYIQARGHTLPVYHGNHSWMLPIPATFVVGRDGRVRARFVDPDYRKRMQVEDLITALNSPRS